MPLDRTELDRQIEAVKKQGPMGPFSFVFVHKLNIAGEEKRVMYATFVDMKFADAIRIVHDISDYRMGLSWNILESNSLKVQVSGTYPSVNSAGSGSVQVSASTAFDVNNADHLFKLRKEIWSVYMELALLSIAVHVFKDPGDPNWNPQIGGRSYYRPNYVTYIVQHGTTRLSSADFLGWSWTSGGTQQTDPSHIQAEVARRNTSKQRMLERIERAQNLWKSKVVYNYQNNPVPKPKPDPKNPDKKTYPQDGDMLLETEWIQKLNQSLLDVLDKLKTKLNSPPTVKMPTRVKSSQDWNLPSRDESLEFTLPDLVIAAASHDPYILLCESTLNHGLYIEHRPRERDTTYTVLAIKREYSKEHTHVDPTGDPLTLPWWSFLHELIHATTPIFHNEYNERNWWPYATHDVYIEDFFTQIRSVAPEEMKVRPY